MFKLLFSRSVVRRENRKCANLKKYLRKRGPYFLNVDITTFNLIFFFFVYLKFRVKGLGWGKKKKSCNILDYFASGPNNQLRTWNSIWVFHTGDRDPSTWVILFLPSEVHQQAVGQEAEHPGHGPVFQYGMPMKQAVAWSIIQQFCDVVLHI